MRGVSLAVVVVALGSVYACDPSPADPRPLAFQGWRVGLSADSARELTLRDAGEALNCASMGEGRGQFCGGGSTTEAPWVRIYVTLSADGQRVESVDIARRVPAKFTTDSLRMWLSDAWGEPDSTTAHPDREPVIPADLTVTWLGHWNSGPDYAYAMESRSPSWGRWLHVELSDRAALLAAEERRGARAPSAERFKP